VGCDPFDWLRVDDGGAGTARLLDRHGRGDIQLMEKQMNIRSGECEDCGHYFTITGGGLNDAGQCKECEKRLPAQTIDIDERKPEAASAT